MNSESEGTTSEAATEVPWVALVGRREEGRARVASRLVERLREQGVPLGGFLQRPVFAQEVEADVGDANEALAYEAESLRTGEVVRVASHGDDPAICAFRFDAAAFARAADWVLDPAAHVSFVEMGPLEARGEGHLPAARRALLGSARLLVFCIRPHVLASIGLNLPDPIDGLELPEEEAEFDAFAARVLDLASAADRL